MSTHIVGILNVTPDSFSDGGKFIPPRAAIEQAKKLFADGADFVDVGGEATNPWAEPITSHEEWQRIKNIIPALLKEFGGKVSLDTMHPETAKHFLELGGKLLNDVSGFQDPAMIRLAVKFQPLCIVNHFPGKNAIEVHSKHIGSFDRVRSDLLRRRGELINAGLQEDKIVLDPGIGFGKTMKLNRKLLEFPKVVPDIPVMIGYSRKRFLGENRFDPEPNLEAAKIAIDAGAAFLRVHDVGLVSKLSGGGKFELLDVVDEDNQKVDVTTKYHAHRHGLLHRTVIGAVKKTNGDIVLVKQAADRQDAGQYVNPVGGHVRATESAEEALKREALEEIGITDFSYRFVGQAIFDRKVLGRHEKHYFIVYEIETDDDLILNHESVEYRSFRSDELVELHKTNSELFGDAHYFVIKEFYPHLLG